MEKRASVFADPGVGHSAIIAISACRVGAMAPGCIAPWRCWLCGIEAWPLKRLRGARADYLAWIEQLCARRATLVARRATLCRRWRSTPSRSPTGRSVILRPCSPPLRPWKPNTEELSVRRCTRRSSSRRAPMRALLAQAPEMAGAAAQNEPHHQQAKRLAVPSLWRTMSYVAGVLGPVRA